jgi:hypothetical protein
VRRTRRKTARELWNTRSKNRFHVRRHEDAKMMGLFNPAILRRWRASMDLQVVESGHAVARYILGYVLKNDTERDAVARLQQLLAQMPALGKVDAQAVYRLAYMSTQGRVTSTFEACHLRATRRRKRRRRGAVRARRRVLRGNLRRRVARLRVLRRVRVDRDRDIVVIVGEENGAGLRR